MQRPVVTARSLGIERGLQWRIGRPVTTFAAMIRALLFTLLLTTPAALARPDAPRAQKKLAEAGVEGVTLVKAHPKASPDEQWASMRLAQGRPALAADHARKCLAERPGATRCTGLLLRALAASGGCVEALALVPGLRQRRGWDAEHAEAEASCWVELGQGEAGVAALEEAVSLADNSAETRFAMLQLHVLAGQIASAEADYAALVELPERGNLVPLARALLDLESGSPDFDASFAELQRAPQTDATRASLAHLHMIDGIAWLDAGDPVLAEAAFSRSVTLAITQFRYAALRAEAFRRQGDLDGAEMILTRPWLVNDTTPIVRAVRARVAADRGRTDEARDILRQLAASDLLEVVATRYYVARALGADADAARFAAEWGARNRVAARSLAQLQPYGATGR